jgi:glycosyltransferase involved in cell wall biosynthesis
MKIMHLVLTPRLSGAEVLVRDLSIAQKNNGHELAFSSINPPEENFLLEIEKLRSHSIKIQTPEFTPNRLQRIPLIRRHIQAFNPSVIFAHSVIPAMYARISDGFNKRTIPVLHATDNYPRNSPHRKIEHLLSRRTKCTIAVSEAGAINYRKTFKNPIHIIRNGLDFSEAQRASTLRSRNKDKARIAIQVGRISPLKGQHISIRAIAKVAKEIPAIQLWLAGLIEDHNYLLDLQTLIKEHGLQENVKFLGPRSDIFDLLAMSDVFLMPSSAEAHSIAMLEALATGIPVVASDIPAFHPFSEMTAVKLLPREDETIHWSNAIVNFDKYPIYNPRDLKTFDIAKTAQEYTEIASRYGYT